MGFNAQNYTQYLANADSFVQKNITKLDCIEPAEKLNKEYMVEAKALDYEFGSRINSKTGPELKKAMNQKLKSINKYVQAQMEAKSIMDAEIRKAQEVYRAAEQTAKDAHQTKEKVF